MNTVALQQAVLELPKTERAHLVHLLLNSLDEPSGSSIQQSWLDEAARRAAEIDQGEVKLVSAAELEAQVQTLFK